jgi:hypothetical protein
MFLEETERQPTRRRRLENWLLLLARCLILILLALMFARPFSRDREAGGVEEGESVVVLLDRSASMRRGELWKRGVEAVREVVEAAGVSDRVAVGLFDGEVEWVMVGEEALPEARRVAVAGLAKVTPGWGETDLGRAMVSGLEVLAQWNEGGRKKRRLVVVSDFQEGAKLAELQKVAWPEGVVAERRVIALDLRNHGASGQDAVMDYPTMAADVAETLAALGAFPKLNPEFIVRAQPEVILATRRHAQEMPGRPGWAVLKALRERQVCGFDEPTYELLVRPGPRMGEAALAMARCLAALPPTP